MEGVEGEFDLGRESGHHVWGLSAVAGGYLSAEEGVEALGGVW